MEQCEKEGDGLHWLGEMAEEVGSGWWKATEEK